MALIELVSMAFIENILLDPLVKASEILTAFTSAVLFPVMVLKLLAPPPDRPKAVKLLADTAMATATDLLVIEPSVEDDIETASGNAVVAKFERVALISLEI